MDYLSTLTYLQVRKCLNNAKVSSMALESDCIDTAWSILYIHMSTRKEPITLTAAVHYRLLDVVASHRALPLEEVQCLPFSFLSPFLSLCPFELPELLGLSPYAALSTRIRASRPRYSQVWKGL